MNLPYNPPIENEEIIQSEVRNPPLYQVILLNDDFTPMDFVVELLKKVFFIAHTQAVEIMLQVHQQGKGICGVYSRDIAETKVAQVNTYARQHEYPLRCVMEST